MKIKSVYIALIIYFGNSLLNLAQGKPMLEMKQPMFLQFYEQYFNQCMSHGSNTSVQFSRNGEVDPLADKKIICNLCAMDSANMAEAAAPLGMAPPPSSCGQ